jgi:outer membrane protein assembly factor BamB
MAKGDIMKRLLLTAVFLCALTYVSCSDPCKWTDYRGNPHRTAYSECTGPETPTELWRIEMAGDFDTPPFIIDGTVLILWKDSAYHPWKSKAILLDLLTGDILHEVETEGFFPKIFPVGNTVLGISGMELYEIDFNTGESTFLASFSGRTFGGTLIYPVVLEDRVIFPTTPAVCLSLSDFHLVWDLNPVTLEKDLAPHDLAGDETLLVFLLSTRDGYRIHAINPETGLLRWRSAPLPGAHWLAMGVDTVYCGGEHLWAFNRNGSKLWEFIPEEQIVSNIVLGLDAVYVADAAHNLYKIGLDGALVWKTDFEGYILCCIEGSVICCDTHLVGAGDILYCIGNFEDKGSQVAAYSMEDGSKVWDIYFEIPDSESAPPFGQIVAPPATQDGIFILGTMTGEILAYASDPDLFVKQGDAYLSNDLIDQAINSFEKASELHKREGNLEQSQEIEKRIHELQNPQVTTPPETTPPESEKPSVSSTPPPPETAPSESKQSPGSPTMPPEPTPVHPLLPPESTFIPISVLVVTGLMGTFIAYYIIKKRKS